LARFLLEQGCCVSGSVRNTSDLSFLTDLPVNLLTGDVSDENFLFHCFKSQDIVFHIAALVSDWATVKALYDVNVQGTIHVARATLKAKVKRLIFVSSTTVYGLNGYQNKKETDSYPEENFSYAVSKQLAEDRLLQFSKEKKLPVTIVQPTNVFGPYDRTFFIKFARALENKMMIFINKGQALTCPTYIENLTEALWLAATKEEAIGETFIISDGLNISWQQFVEKICQELQAPIPRISINFKSAYALATLIEGIYKFFQIKQAPPITRYRVCNAGRDYHFSIEKAHRILGYSPRINLDEAIRRTVNWYRESFG
jgi:nucleoside-diphosphate-sugar epimerase